MISADAIRRTLRRSRAEPVAVSKRDRLTPLQQIGLQLICLFIGLTVLFPIIWIFSMSIDPRNISRPYELTLIPPGASLDAYLRVWEQPSANPVSFLTLAKNSLLLAGSTAFFSVAIGVLAAYAFSRLQFPGRQVLMIAVLGVLMLPPVATLAPLFVQLNGINVDIAELGLKFNLRNSLAGVGLAITSGLLPFAIWNLKGYLDTIPKDLEEAAAVDGATKNQTFLKITLPLATPALAVTAFLGFLGGWTEFYFASTFLTKPEDYTLAVALNSMVGAYATQTPWSDFAAFAILVAAPVSIVYLFFQQYIVSGLAIGGVKG
ncbi:MAG: ABC transporter permease subunit [Chloroflexi bacterium]|nr:ABC transporter permease subunit [Chloroflexota bacterium]